MRLELIRRPEHSTLMALLSPLVALVLTLVFGLMMFWVLGVDPFRGLYVFFIEPLTELWSLEALLVKAIPIIIVAIGLSVCYLANNWNIGAEGQFVFGAITGSMLPVLFPTFDGPLVLPLMLIMGTAGGMIYAAVPALLKTRFNANEILTSLMLVYVAQYLLDYLARGPWRDPQGYNFPDSRPFTNWQLLPDLFGTVPASLIFAVVVAAAALVLMRNTLSGFAIQVLGQAPRAGAFAGFSRNRIILITFLISGGLAGLAGISEVMGPIERLRISVSPGYGFTAIIVAFLGRLNPIGIVIAGLILALTYLGGEAAQISLQLSDQVTRVFQGMLLFFVLACDTFILYRLRIVRPAAATVEAGRGHR